MRRSIQLVRGAQQVWPGVLAQTLTFANLFIPILLGAQEQLVALVQSTAIAAILVQTVTHAAPGRLPSIEDEIVAKRLRTAALISSALASACLAIVGITFTLIGSGAVSIWLGGAVVLAAQALYTIYVAELTRQFDYRGILVARLAYAILLVVLTTITCLLHAPGFWLAVGAAISFVAGGLAALISARARLRSFASAPGRLRPREYFGEVRVAGPLAFAYLLGGFSGQAGALALAGLGTFQPAWAVAVRIMNGMQTIGGQFLAPRADIDIAKTSRAEGGLSVSAALRKALLMCVVLAVGTLGLSAAALVYSGVYLRDFADDAELVVALVGYAALTTGITVIGRTLGLIGSHRVRLVWEIARAISFGLVLVFARNESLLILLGIVGALSSVSYVLLCMRAARRCRTRTSSIAVTAS